MIIKVCGMREPNNIRAVESSGATWIGFNFYEPSKRYVGTEKPAYLPACLRVGVFVNASLDQIQERIAQYRLNAVQLHGNESPELCHALQSLGTKVIKVFSVGTSIPADIANYEGCCDYFLFDTQCKGYGGSGQQFDWSILDAYTGSIPFLLAGGLNPESLSAVKALRHPQFAGLDLNSGFELAPALKDAAKIKEFISNLNS